VIKPESCQPCPWYQTGNGFVPDETQDSEVFILTQNPGQTEEDFGQPAIGQAGKDMDYNFIPLASLKRGDSCTVGTVLKCRWNKSSDLPGDSAQMVAVTHCIEAHLRIPPSTKLIIAQGKLAFEYAHGGQLREDDGKLASLSNWRGFILPLQYTAPRFGAVPVFVMLHSADLYHNPSMEVVTQWDWMKVRRILDGEYPKPLPSRIIATEENLHDIRRWFMEARLARWVTVDTEYYPSNRCLTILGLVARYPDGRVDGCQLDVESSSFTVREFVYYCYQELIQHVTIIFHNCRADIPVLQLAIKDGVDWEDYKAYEDTMLGHAILWCELPHTLQFIASVHGQYQKLKHLKVNDELLYNFGDCLETDSIWLYLTEEGFKHDPQAEAIYRTQSLSLCPILERSIARGLKVDGDRVKRAKIEYESNVIHALQLAHAGAGWPINLNSNRQVGSYLYDLRGLPHQVNKKSGNQSIDDEAVARLRMGLGPPFDPEEDLTYDEALKRIEQGADPILEARVLYAGASTRLIKYIYALYACVEQVKPYNYPTKGAYEKAKDQAITAVKEGTETAVVERIHPDFLIHSQKTGRWSTVNPPIAQLPQDLRDLIIPDSGEVWVSWDWKSIEPRILEGYCHSRVLKKAFDEGLDIHTWTVCSIFNYEYPPNLCEVMKAPENAAWREKYGWRTSNDPRRVFAKTARYEMYYGGTGANAAAAAALFGLDPKVLRKACATLISADSEYYTWRLNLEEQIKRTRVLRTFMGRPRRFLKGGHKMVREGLDQPMQGGVSDIANTTVVALDRLGVEGFQFAWSMHDSQKWHLPRTQCTLSFLKQIKAIAERTHVIEGRVIPFPIDLEIIYPPGEEEIPGLEEYTH